MLKVSFPTLLRLMMHSPLLLRRMVLVLVAKGSAPDAAFSIYAKNASDLLKTVALSHCFGPGSLEDGPMIVSTNHCLTENKKLLWYPAPGGSRALTREFRMDTGGSH